jgi:site-specific recombinase XerD
VWGSILLPHYFAFLRGRYKSQRKNGDASSLSGSILQNHWKGVRSFFRWAVEELHLKKRPDEKLKLSANNFRVVFPLSENAVKKLIKTAEFSREAKTIDRKIFKTQRI